MSLAPAATKDGFAFAGDLFAEASGHNRHRRATAAELKDHFKNGSDKDRPAHWFEAQLTHYGLPPSKTKAVARMRLYDAVNAGKMTVPAHIQKLEADLKKEWTKREREAKKVLKEGSSSTSTALTAASTAQVARGTKRKAESSSVNFNLSVGGLSVSLSASHSSSSSQTAKKAKTIKTATTTTKAAKETAKPKTTTKSASSTSSSAKTTKVTSTPKTTKAAVPKGTTSSAAKPKVSTSVTKYKAASAKKAAVAVPSPSVSTVKKQTARRGGHTQGPCRAGSASKAAPSPKAPRTKQTARRSGAFAAQGGRAPAQPQSSSSNGYDEPPPPYTEYADGGYISSDNDNGYPQARSSGTSSSDYDHGYPQSRSSSNISSDNDSHNDRDLRPLCLLNGRYNLVSKDVSSRYADDFSLILTLHGSELWGKFDLGVLRGILRLDRGRPYESSRTSLDFTWRGQEEEKEGGQMFYGGGNRGWIRFLGDGRVKGEFDHMRLGFGGDRVRAQGTRSEVDAVAMYDEWDGYS